MIELMIEFFFFGIIVGLPTGFGLAWLYMGWKIKKMLGNIGQLSELFGKEFKIETDEPFIVGEKDEDLNNRETEVTE